MSAAKIRWKSRFPWVFFNFIGMCTYLWVENRILASRPTGETSLGPDERHAWVMMDLPILTVFFLADLVWLILLLRKVKAGYQVSISGLLLVTIFWPIILLACGGTAFAMLKFAIAM